MGDPRGFLTVERADFAKRDPAERTDDYGQFIFTRPDEELADQGARCMDCGVPFCHEGCPLGNLIPDWNDLVYRDQWREAIDQLHRTNNFPEFTGLVCPAPCESACVLDINSDPVAIKQIELGIIERAFEEGWVTPRPPETRTGRRVAVIGSGPAGLAAADQLNQQGHSVVVFERDEAAGGMMRFGVPDPKLEKWIIDRRVGILEAEGIELRCDTEIGRDVPASTLHRDFDAVVLAMGARVQRDMYVPGRELAGMHPAMDYLYVRNRWVAAQQGRPAREPADPIVAKGKRVVVLGGGDTGMDCVSNAIREEAEDAVLLDTYDPLPPEGRYPDSPWPEAPRRTATTYALDEGGERRNNRIVTRFEGSAGRVVAIHGAEMRGSTRAPEIVEGTEFRQEADLVLIAIGFVGPEPEGPIAQLGVDTDRRTNVKAGTYATNVEGVFACGDVRTGATLIVTAIAEGRKCARIVDRFLGGLPE